MKTIGLLGGMSWESTIEYYRQMNLEVRRRLGGYHSAKLVLQSFDFHEIEQLQSAGKWSEAGDLLGHTAELLVRSGADAIVICTNTMHKVAGHVESKIDVPLLHIGDATAVELNSQGVSTVGLIGTRFTMEDGFYQERLEKFGVNTLVPDAEDRRLIHRVIFEELCQGKLVPESRDAYVRAIEALALRGAQAVILGCTEIGLLVNSRDTPIPLFDTVQIHARRAVHFSLA